jgi:hypothetical protein
MREIKLGPHDDVSDPEPTVVACRGDQGFSPQTTAIAA